MSRATDDVKKTEMGEMILKGLEENNVHYAVLSSKYETVTRRDLRDMVSEYPGADLEGVDLASMRARDRKIGFRDAVATWAKRQ
jgi:hypothetical protein